MSLINYRCLLRLIFTYLHTDLILAPQPRFEVTSVDCFFSESVQKSISPILLRKYVLYKLPTRYAIGIEVPNPLIRNNDYLPGTCYYRTNMFSDIIPLVINLLTRESIRQIGTYRKILLRRFYQLQDSSFCNWNEFLDLVKKPIFLQDSSYAYRNRIDRHFVVQFITGIENSKKLSFYLNYTGEGLTNALLL